MARKKIKEKAGRKQYIIDWSIVDYHLEAGCTGTQVAAILGMHPETLYDRTVEEKKVTHFTDYLQQKRAKGDANIHILQYKSANRGCIQMLIWLGKNRLGQRDKHPDEVDTNIAYNVVINEIP